MDSKSVFLALGILSMMLLFSSAACNIKPIACTQEAKICPDGSAVGRVGPSCEFAPCPGNTQAQNPVQPGNTVAGAVPCGGWDTFGEVVCGCAGQLDKDICPSDAQCDGETYLCKGICGACRCYRGQASGKNEIPCDGRDRYFT
jgi:hypothetical protein